MNQEKISLLIPILNNLGASSIFGKYFDTSEVESKLDEFTKVISTEGHSILDFKGLSRDKIRKLLKELIPERDPKLNRDVGKYLLHVNGLRACKKCNNILNLSDFRPNISKGDGINGQCKYCQAKSTATTQPKRQALYKSSVLNRTMPWSDMEKISKFYDECPEGYHVDHIVPLQGKIVSGLHVLENLQYLTALENIKKHNKYIAE